MSAVTTPNDSPIHPEPMHNPSRAAQVVVPQAPLGNATYVNQKPGMGARALLAKKMSTKKNPKFVSPTDNMLTPCSKKISAAKKKRFDKGIKPTQGGLFQSHTVEDSNESGSGSDEEQSGNKPEEKRVNEAMDDPENPF